MNKKPQGTIGGSGGGKGSSGGEFYHQPDTIRSVATARLLVALSAGPIAGLATADGNDPAAGANSILFDGIPLPLAGEAAQNSGLIAWATTPGDAAQEPVGLKGFNAVENTVNANDKITTALPWRKAAPRGQNGYDAVRITLRFPGGLVRRNSAGIFGTAVKLAIDRSLGRHPVTGAVQWEEVQTPTIAEKQTAFFEVQFLVDLQDTADGVTPEIRVRRLTADNDGSAELRDEVRVASVTWIRWDRLSYPGVSLLAMRIGAGSFSGRLPRLSVKLKGRLIKVPVNYDPATRSSAGFWNGSFKTRFCNNPAWVLFDLLTDRDWGLGIDESLIEKYDLHDIAQYADGLVADGRGGMEPRFLFDGVIARRVAAADLIGQICAAMRVSYFWSGGRLRFIQDRPAEPVLWLTNTHVEGGNFVYTGPSGEAAYSHALVSFTDTDGGGVAVEAESNRDILADHGYRAREVALLGCTRRSQARRHARWLLEIAALGLHGIAWQASIDHLAENPVRPGDIVRVHDTARLGADDLTGRVHAVAADHITAALDCAPGDGLLDYESTDAGWQEGVAVNLTETRSHGRTLIKIAPQSGTWGETPAKGGAILLHTDTSIAASDQARGEDYRVLAVRERDNHRFEISAMRYDPAIYDRSESGFAIDPPAADGRATGPIPAATNLVFRQPAAIAGQIGGRDIHAGWTPPQDPRIARWRLVATGPDGEVAEVEVHRPPAILPAPAAGDWEARLVPVDWAGREGSEARGRFSVNRVSPPRDGRDGAPGRDGRRGSVIARGTVTSRRWSNTAARAAITATAGAGEAPVNGDIVTLHFTARTGDDWSESRQWDGTGWVAVTDVISGEVIAGHSLPASRIKLDPNTLGSDGTPADRLAIKSLSADLITTGALQSRGYVAGESGFRIDLDGSAEFNDAEIRGALVGSRISGALIVASTSAFPTEAGGRFLTLDTPRLLAVQNKRLSEIRTNPTGYSNTVTFGPLAVAPDVVARRLGDEGNKLIAHDDPHGDDMAGAVNDYYSRFWAAAPEFTIRVGFTESTTPPPWGRYINTGSFRLRVLTESGKEIADTGTRQFTQLRYSQWQYGNRDVTAYYWPLPIDGFRGASLISVTRTTTHEFPDRAPGAQGRSYTGRIVFAATLKCDLSHAHARQERKNARDHGAPEAEWPPEPVANDGFKIELQCDFGDAALTRRIVRAFQAGIPELEGTTHD